MTDRIPLADLTADALDALYEQLEAAEETETQRQLAVAREAFASATSRAARAEKELAALRQVARGYCPACGRGDAAPTVEDWEQQKQRADRAEQETTGTATAAALMVNLVRERAERAEAAITRVRELHREEYGCCTECTGSHAVLYPCPTIQALDGEQP